MESKDRSLRKQTITLKLTAEQAMAIMWMHAVLWDECKPTGKLAYTSHLMVLAVLSDCLLDVLKQVTEALEANQAVTSISDWLENLEGNG